MNRLAHIISGAEQFGTIVAFHGVTDSAASLADIATHFGENWRVVLVDSLGHGLSARFNAKDLETPFEAAALAACEMVTQIAAQSFGRSVVLLGHSMGGAIACEVALRCPQLIRGLVLEDPALLTTQQADSYRVAAADLVARQEEVSANLGLKITNLQENYPNWSAQEVAGWAQAKTQSDRNFLARGVVGREGREILEELTVPTLLLTGDGENVLIGSDGLAQIAAFGNRHIRTCLIKDASHTVRRDNAADYYAAVDSFIATLSPIQPAWPERVVLDPQIEKELANIPEQTTWDLVSMRAEGERLLSQPLQLPPGVTREVMSLNGVECRIFYAGDLSDATRMLFAIHGGGYVAGKAAYDDAHSAEMVQEFQGTILVSPEYRLAPQSAYPEPVNDCLASFLGALVQYPNLPVYLYGDSAGGGLVNQLLQNEIVHSQPRLKGAITLEPCLSPRLDTASYRTYSAGPVWTRVASEHAWHHYADGVESQKVFPVDLETVAKYPRMLVYVNAADPLRDEGISWALQLTDAGVHVDLHLLAGTYHGALTVPQTQLWEQLKSDIREFFEQDRFANF